MTDRRIDRNRRRLAFLQSKIRFFKKNKRKILVIYPERKKK